MIRGLTIFWLSGGKNVADFEIFKSGMIGLGLKFSMSRNFKWLNGWKQHNKIQNFLVRVVIYSRRFKEFGLCGLMRFWSFVPDLLFFRCGPF